ncbi:MAG: dephospho-CoA kinase [Eubacteriales bacterium]|nr:dephospho-CoA kinase [Eubacteriales bacterium]
MKKPFTIGLTGQTGAGKGYVCDYLKSLGFNIINCDDCVKEIYENNPKLFDELKENFGQDIIVNNAVDRKRLSEIVFSDDKRLALLNSIVHPAVISLCESKAKIPSVLDAPQLFEANAQKKCYKVIAVTASYKTRLERIISRDGISKEQARARMESQLNEEYFIKNSDFVIINDGTEDIKKQIETILEEII